MQVKRDLQFLSSVSKDSVQSIWLGGILLCAGVDALILLKTLWKAQEVAKIEEKEKSK